MTDIRESPIPDDVPVTSTRPYGRDDLIGYTPHIDVNEKKVGERGHEAVQRQFRPVLIRDKDNYAVFKGGWVKTEYSAKNCLKKVCDQQVELNQFRNS